MTWILALASFVLLGLASLGLLALFVLGCKRI